MPDPRPRYCSNGEERGGADPGSEVTRLGPAMELASPTPHGLHPTRRRPGSPSHVCILGLEGTAYYLQYFLNFIQHRILLCTLRSGLVVLSVPWVILGHSERRSLLGESSEVAGAAADAGLSLADVAAEAKHASEAVGTMGVALSICMLHGQVTSDRLGPEQIELDLGIHGEPSAAVVELRSVDVVVEHVLKKILSQVKPLPAVYPESFLHMFRPNQGNSFLKGQNACSCWKLCSKAKGHIHIMKSLIPRMM